MSAWVGISCVIARLGTCGYYFDLGWYKEGFTRLEVAVGNEISFGTRPFLRGHKPSARFIVRISETMSPMNLHVETFAPQVTVLIKSSASPAKVLSALLDFVAAARSS